VDVSESTSKREDNLSLKQFEILKFLGKGAFGKVYAVRKRYTEDLYALKLITID
jgi:p70 ribosomal S6 kinase